MQNIITVSHVYLEIIDCKGEEGKIMVEGWILAKNYNGAGVTVHGTTNNVLTAFAWRNSSEITLVYEIDYDVPATLVPLDTCDLVDE